MTLREAIYKAGAGGRIRLEKLVLAINAMDKPLGLNYIFTAEELVSTKWEAQVVDWTADYD